MFPRSSQTSCRLTPRRRLAMGGLAVTTALVAGVFVSTPAFADTPGAYQVHDISGLESALNGSQTSIELASDFDGTDTGALDPTTVATSKQLDLNGRSVDLDRVTVGDDVELDVIDSTAANGTVGQGSISFSAGSGATTPVSGVQLGSDAKLHVIGASLSALGADGGAGIGSVGTGASFLADGGASIRARGSSHVDSSNTVDGGGAGIGGSNGADDGIDVTVGNAFLDAYGGAGAAGIGGGDGGDGGQVSIGPSADVDAEQGAAIGSNPVNARATDASSIGAGQGAAHFGTLRVHADAFLQLSSTSPLLLRPDAVVVNDGEIDLDGSNGPGEAISGQGTIDNTGIIRADSGDVDSLIDSSVGVTGHNYDLTVNANGGTIAGATHAHLYSGSVSALVPFFGGVTPPSDDVVFWKWTTRTDGSGTAVTPTYPTTDDLAAVGASTDGSAVPVTLYAQFAHAPAGTRDSLPDAVVGTAYDQPLPVSGDGLTSYQVAGPQSSSDPGSVLPAGLSINSTTGRITGTPTEPFDGEVAFDVTGVGENIISFHIAVGGVPAFGTASLPSGTAGTPYATTLAVSGGPATYSVATGALPAGLSLNATSGAVTGTPTAGGTASFTVRATNRFGSTDRAFTIGIAAAPVAAAPAPGSAPAKPVLIRVPRTTVGFGHALTLAVTASSALPVTFGVAEGSLPKGVRLDAKTGLISGTAAQSGTVRAEVAATSAAGTATTEVVIVVPEVQHLLSTKGSVPAVKAGAGSVPVRIAGFKKGERWTVRVDGRVVQHGTMKKAGTLSVKVRLGKAMTDRVHTIRIAGSRTITDPAKTASTSFTVTSLAAKKTLRVQTVSANGVKLVAVEKLAAGEQVVVRDRGRVIAKGHASEYGIFTFPQSKAGKGTSRLTVRGAALKRAGTLTVKNPKP